MVTWLLFLVPSLSVAAEDGRELKDINCNTVQFYRLRIMTQSKLVKQFKMGSSYSSIITEVAGKIKYSGMQGSAIKTQTDELTGFLVISLWMMLNVQRGKMFILVLLLSMTKVKSYHPGTNVTAHYFLSSGAVFSIAEGGELGVGDVIARIPQAAEKTKILR